MSILKKRVRLEHANTLIKLISDHGRRFFYFDGAARVARLEIVSGHIYFRDDYTDVLVHVHKNFSNRNFSHGGTLSLLIEKIACYVRTGEQLSMHWLGPEAKFIDSNIWGYDAAAIETVRTLAAALPIMKEKSKSNTAEAA